MKKPVRVNGRITDGFLLLDHQPQVAVSGNKVYIVWVSHYPGNDDIYFTKSSDGGASFGKIINISNDPGDSYDPHISLSGNSVYIIWVDGTPGPRGNPDILFKRSTNGGTTFGPTINLSNNPGFSDEPEVAISGSNVYVAWRDNTPGNEEILFKRSINSGASFGNTVYLSDNSSKPINSVRPQIAANGNDVYVVWKQIFFRRSIDGGATFGNTINITNSTTGDSFNPQVAASDNNVYLLWQSKSGNGIKQLLFKRSIDGGATFGNTINMSDDRKDSANPLLDTSGNNVYETWDDNSTGNSQIFFKRSIDSGATFSPTLSLSNVKGQSQYPDITSFNNNIYAVWQDRILRNIGIFFKRIM